MEVFDAAKLRQHLVQANIVFQERDRDREVHRSTVRHPPRMANWSQWTGAILNWDIREGSFYREHCGYPLEFRIRWTLDFPRRETGKF